MFSLRPEPMTKEELERELLTLPLAEAESQREFWTLCEALQAMEDTRCPPPDWFLATFQKVLEQPSGERAEPWRKLRHYLLEHLGKWQREPRALATLISIINKRFITMGLPLTGNSPKTYRFSGGRNGSSERLETPSLQIQRDWRENKNSADCQESLEAPVPAAKSVEDARISAF